MKSFIESEKEEMMLKIYLGIWLDWLIDGNSALYLVARSRSDLKLVSISVQRLEKGYLIIRKCIS
jgi:hypothetical protein